jgi:hypothetical protein
MKLSEIINRLSELSTAINAYWAAEMAKQFPGRICYSLAELDETMPPSPPQKKELLDLLTGLPPATLFMLAGIMYLGRGDFDAEDDLLDIYQQMSDSFVTPRRAVEKLAGKACLGDYLIAGVEKLTRRGFEVERLLET